MGCGPWVQIWPKYHHCNYCAVCIIVSYIATTYQESIVTIRAARMAEHIDDSSIYENLSLITIPISVIWNLRVFDIVVKIRQRWYLRTTFQPGLNETQKHNSCVLYSLTKIWPQIHSQFRRLIARVQRDFNLFGDFFTWNNAPLSIQRRQVRVKISQFTCISTVCTAVCTAWHQQIHQSPHTCPLWKECTCRFPYKRASNSENVSTW